MGRGLAIMERLRCRDGCFCHFHLSAIFSGVRRVHIYTNIYLCNVYYIIYKV